MPLTQQLNAAQAASLNESLEYIATLIESIADSAPDPVDLIDPQEGGALLMREIADLRGLAQKLEARCFSMMTSIGAYWQHNYVATSSQPKKRPTIEDLAI